MCPTKADQLRYVPRAFWYLSLAGGITLLIYAIHRGSPVCVCGGTLRVIACIEAPELIERILTHRVAGGTGWINHPHTPPLRAPGAEPPATPSLSAS